ncbi:CubicO group peptidase (beta-lactamase class C family) [Micromonospora sp. M71_S20]|uniref:serine hydrolase domain-containing protein n=1 Tax=Micromonospora sp. M71_S20 TaxID=592872 RepID=UPI000F23D01D|nr:serine hydrolase domain-containing protein [Micromonospora sp. M71_S20]RLK23905.1 CubicO group peptidase (beta-lactamase class C family) [Micromonospora sp. M71_S20]
MGFEEEWQDLVPGTDRISGIGVAVGGLDGDVWTDGHDLLFPACSISKHVAAFGTLRLVADATLDLDTDVNAYLSAWQLPGTGTVTVRQLLAHTAGLTENWFPGYAAGQPVPSLQQILRGEPPANTPRVRRELPPGTEFRYSGSHYAVLEQLLTDVTSTPFDKLMATLVLEPVGMADSSYDQHFPNRHRDRAARGHCGGTPVHGGWHTQPEMAGAGLWSTPADLVRLELEICRAVAGESALLPQDLAAQMLTPQVPGGFGLGTELGDGRFGHTGQNTGYRCFSFAWPVSGTAVAVMMNAEDCRDTLLALIELAGRNYG